MHKTDETPRGVLKLLDYSQFITGKMARQLLALHPNDLSWHDGTGITAEDTFLEHTNAFLKQGGSLTFNDGFEPPRPIWISVRGDVYDVTCKLPLSLLACSLLSDFPSQPYCRN